MTNTEPILTALEAIRKDISVLRSEQEKQRKAVERLEQRQIQTNTSTCYADNFKATAGNWQQSKTHCWRWCRLDVPCRSPIPG